MDQFKKMDLLKDSGSKDKSQNSYQELKRAMSTQIFHKESKLNKTIKEKLEKGLYKD